MNYGATGWQTSELGTRYNNIHTFHRSGQPEFETLCSFLTTIRTSHVSRVLSNGPCTGVDFVTKRIILTLLGIESWSSR
jgi:hypothetical protein